MEEEESHLPALVQFGGDLIIQPLARSGFVDAELIRKSPVLKQSHFREPPPGRNMFSGKDILTVTLTEQHLGREGKRTELPLGSYNQFASAVPSTVPFPVFLGSGGREQERV
ncbi:UNVERIFIED_CONTAM: hypothetical protein K2H54_020321 [Gekko kuhli]